MSPRADHETGVEAAGVERSGVRRVGAAALVAGLGLALAGGLLGGTALAAPAPGGAESWGAELAIEGGDDRGVVLVGEAVRLVGDPATGTPSTATPSASPTVPITGTRPTTSPAPVPTGPVTGELVLAPRRTVGPTDTVSALLTANRPAGSSVVVEVRGLRPDGRWGAWVPARGDDPARLGVRTTEIQVRVLLRGPQGGAGPVVRGLWLTSSLAATDPATTAPKPTTTTPKPTSTTPQPTTTTAPKPTTTTPKPTSTTTPPASTTTTSPVTSTTTPPVTSTTTPPVSTLPVTVPVTKPPTTTPTTTTPTSAAPAVGAPAAWTADIAQRGLGGFEDTPYNTTGKSSIKLVDGPPRAIRFTVPAGSQRAELEPKIPDLEEGQQRFFRLTYVLPTGFPVDATDFQLVSQWKNEGTGSPPLELDVESGGLALSGGFGRPGGSRLFRTDIGPITAGRTIDVVVGVLFSSDPAKGSVDVWLDGTQRIKGFRPPGGTLYPGLSSYWKVGLYRDTDLSTDAVADLTAARSGPSYDSVTGAAD